MFRSLKIASTLAVLASTVAVVPATSDARPQFSGNVCALLKPSLLNGVDVVPKCKPTKTATTPGATVYGAYWGGAGNLVDPTYHRLSVSVFEPRSALFSKSFKQQAQGTPVKLGTFARADVTYGGENLFILAKGQAVLINLVHQAHTSAQNSGEIGAAMFAIGKAIVSKL